MELTCFRKKTVILRSNFKDFVKYENEFVCVSVSYRKSSAKHFPGAFLCDPAVNVSVRSHS